MDEVGQRGGAAVAQSGSKLQPTAGLLLSEATIVTHLSWESGVL
jgi:hypothetical protein